MAHPDFNRPNDDCPECTVPSKTRLVGGRTEDGVGIYTWTCEHEHRWEIREVRQGSKPPPSA